MEYHPLHVLDSLFPKSHYTYICPLCLEEAEGGYYRLYWRMPYLLSCLKHHVVLQRHCPQCRRPIRALRRDLFHCTSCLTGDYRHLQGSFLSTNDLLFMEEHLIANALGIPFTTSVQLPEELTTSPLLQLEPRDYLSLFIQTRSFSRNLSQREVMCYFGTMFRLFPYQEIIS